MRAVDAVAFRAQHEVVARSAPGRLLLYFDIGHAVLGEKALVLGDEQWTGVAERDKAELGRLHFRTRILRKGAGREIQLGRGKQCSRSTGRLQDLTAAETA